MHDIVKAVGNCSYNQLVEKIISCKQSDNSELAGEGERSLFTLDVSDLPNSPPVSPHRFSFPLSVLASGEGDIFFHFNVTYLLKCNITWVTTLK